MLSTLRTIARLPALAASVAQTTGEIADRLSALQPAVATRLAGLDGGVRDLVARLAALADDLARVRSTVEPQYERIAAIEDGLAVLPRLASDLEQLRAKAGPELERISPMEQSLTRLEAHVAALQRTLSEVKGDVEDVTEHLPDPDAPGPLARARDALTGNN